MSVGGQKMLRLINIFFLKFSLNVPWKGRQSALLGRGATGHLVDVHETKEQLEFGGHYVQGLRLSLLSKKKKKPK